MAFPVVGEYLLYLWVKLYTVLVAGPFHDSPSSERLDGPFQEFVGLQAHDQFVFLVNISGFMGCNGRNGLGVNGAHAVVFPFFLHGGETFVPDFHRPFRRAAEE